MQDPQEKAYRELLAVVGAVVCCLLLTAAAAAQTARPLGKISAADPNLLLHRDVGSKFGISTSGIGDLDGDGTADLAIGEPGAPGQPGAVWILFLNPSGTVRHYNRISATDIDLTSDLFGWALAFVGDLDADGLPELAVAERRRVRNARTRQLTRVARSGLHLLSLRPDGSVGRHEEVLLDGGDLAVNGDINSLATVGDLDRDGIPEIAIGTRGLNVDRASAGGVSILFLTAEGQLKRSQPITNGVGGLAQDALGTGDAFGESVSGLGDVDADGVPDLAVGAVAADGAGVDRGAVRVLFLHRDGTVKSEQLIDDRHGSFGELLYDGDGFGGSLASLGDLDGDGIPELAVGASRRDGDTENQGAMWVLFLRADGSVKHEQQVGVRAGGFGGFLAPLARFGYSIAGLRDLNGDGWPDLVVGVNRAEPDREGGGVWVLFMGPEGRVRHQQAINSIEGGLVSTLEEGDAFGTSVVRIGDLDGDGLSELAVGAPGDDADGLDRGAIWILFLDRDGHLQRHQKLSAIEGGFQDAPASLAGLGRSLAAGGDMDHDGIPDLVVSTGLRPQLGSKFANIWILLLRTDGTVRRAMTVTLPEGDPSLQADGEQDERSRVSTRLGHTVAVVGDLDGNGMSDLVVGSMAGDAYALFLDPEGRSLRTRRIPLEAIGMDAPVSYRLMGIGDLDGDDRSEMAVSALSVGPDGWQAGVTIVFLGPRGGVERTSSLALEQAAPAYEADLLPGPPVIGYWNQIVPVSAVGDADGDGTPDLGIGVPTDATPGSAWVFHMRPNGSVDDRMRVSIPQDAGFGNSRGGAFGSGMALLGDPGSDQPRVLAIGDGLDDTTGRDRGAVYVFALEPWYAAVIRLAALVAGLFLLLGLATLGGVRFHTRRLRRRNIQLESLVSARTAEVNSQVEQIRELSALKSRFLANISHEFRTPLTLTFGPIDDLLDGRYQTIEATKPAFERARRNGQRLLRLINELLDLTKLEVGALLLRPQRSDLAGLLRRAVSLFERMASLRQIRIVSHGTDGEFFLGFDPERIERVIINLLSNAFKYTPDGGTIELGLRVHHTAGAVVSILDTGVGIPADSLERVFDRFYRVENSASQHPNGAGIGLALVKELVELHGGTIEVISTLGVGSCFTIWLPDLAVEPPESVLESMGVSQALEHEMVAAATAAPPLLTEVPEDSAIVLVVEDNTDMRAYIRSHLKEDYVVVEAANGSAGVKLAREFVPDVIVSDVLMPELDGLGLLAAIQEDSRTSHIPVILLTALADVESRIAGFESGADSYLPKPFNAAELSARIQGLLAQRQRLRFAFGGDGGTRREHGSPDSAVSDLPDRERRFVAQVEAVIAERLSASSFGVEQLAEGVGMSRRQVLRKLRALTGETPTELIRRMRLECAYARLAGGVESVKEVGFGVGFESTSYFSRAFRKQYGRSPSEV